MHKIWSPCSCANASVGARRPDSVRAYECAHSQMSCWKHHWEVLTGCFAAAFNPINNVQASRGTELQLFSNLVSSKAAFKRCTVPAGWLAWVVGAHGWAPSLATVRAMRLHLRHMSFTRMRRLAIPAARTWCAALRAFSTLPRLARKRAGSATGWCFCRCVVRQHQRWSAFKSMAAGMP